MGELFIHLKLARFNDFAVGITELEDVYTPKEIGKIYHILLVTQIKLEHFFSAEIKDLYGIISVVFLAEILKCDKGTGRIGVKTNRCGGCIIRETGKPALGVSGCGGKKHHKKEKVEIPHSLPDKIRNLQCT
jgi:hypothetical protein